MSDFVELREPLADPNSFGRTPDGYLSNSDPATLARRSRTTRRSRDPSWLSASQFQPPPPPVNPIHGVPSPAQGARGVSEFTFEDMNVDISDIQAIQNGFPAGTAPTFTATNGTLRKPKSTSRFVGGFVSGLKRLPRAVISKSSRPSRQPTGGSVPPYFDSPIADDPYPPQPVAGPSNPRMPSEPHPSSPTTSSHSQPHIHSPGPRSPSGDTTSAVSVDPAPASDYDKMASPITHTPASLETHLSRIRKFVSDFSALPWVASSSNPSARVAVDFIPGGASPKPRGGSESWYTTRHARSLDLLAGSSSAHIMGVGAPMPPGMSLPPPVQMYGRPGVSGSAFAPPPPRQAYSADEQHNHTGPGLGSGPGPGPGPGSMGYHYGYGYPAQQIYMLQPPGSVQSNVNLHAPMGIHANASTAEMAQIMPLYMVAGPPTILAPAHSPPGQIHASTPVFSYAYPPPQAPSPGPMNPQPPAPPPA